MKNPIVAVLRESNPIKLILILICLAVIDGCSGSSGSSGSDDNTADDSANSGTLVINEIVAKDPDGGNDWIELYVTEGTVALGDYTIVDDDVDHEPEGLPDVLLSAGEFYIIEAIDEEDECPDGSSCVSFKLGSDDGVTLFKNDVQVNILDWAEGDADDGESYGLLPDGSGSPQTLSPTKGAANEALADTDDDDDNDDTDTIEDSNAAVMINEIVSKATADGEDWIEFYVSGTETINLSDYTVVDDSDGREPATLPNVNLAPGEFYVVLATDEAPEDGSAYVPFKLGSDDSVSLFQEDDLIDKLDWSDGEALIGYSYGRYSDGSENTQTLSPTPGDENEVAERGDLVINEIMAKDSNGGLDWFELYNAGDTVVNLADYAIVDDGKDEEPAALPDLSLSPGDFVVIYATGEETDEVQYYVEFKLGGSDSLSLILDDEVVDYMEWEDTNAPAGFSFGLYPDGAWDSQTLEMTPGTENELVDFFSEDTVEDIYITISEANWNSLLDSPLEEEYHTASITYRDVTLDDVAFRTKGNSSLQAVAQMNSTRYSFKVDMNYYVDGQKLLGMKKINLNNNYKDPSYMRERLAYDMMRSLGIPTPRLSYVNLYINGSLHGLYTLVEQVDSEFLEANFENPEGDLYKPDGTGSDLLWTGADFAAYSGVELKTNEESSDNAAFINMVNELNNGSDLGSVIDVDEVLRYLAVSTALSNLDSYQGTLAHNYYLYEQDGVFSIIPWDFNESFGTFRMGCQDSNTMISLYIDEPTSSTLADRPLIARLLEYEAYKTAYHGYVEDLMNTFDGVMDPGIISNTIADTEDLISSDVYNDPTAFYSYAEFEASLGDTMIDNDIFGLYGFVVDRTENMTAQLSGDLPIEGDGSGSCGGGTTPPGPPTPPGP
jgi:spore coat protein CotH